MLNTTKKNDEINMHTGNDPAHILNKGNSGPNQHEKMSTPSELNETWGTHTLPQTNNPHPISAPHVVWLPSSEPLKIHKFWQYAFIRWLITFALINSRGQE